MTLDHSSANTRVLNHKSSKNPSNNPSKSPSERKGNLRKKSLAEHPCTRSQPSVQVREKLIRYGIASLSDAELLAVLFGTGTQGLNALELAAQLLAEFGGLQALMCAEAKQVNKIRGIGQARSAQLGVVLELGRRTAFETLSRGDVLSSPGKVREFLSLQLAGLEHEVFAAIFLDNRHRVLQYQPLFTGTIDGASVHPREVVKRCLSANAAAIIFAHNHPSGVAEPSEADIAITRKLRDALSLVDVRVLDHLIIGQGVQTSLAERGVI